MVLLQQGQISQLFNQDGDYPLLCSLEEVSEDGEVKKAAIFFKQTVKAQNRL